MDIVLMSPGLPHDGATLGQRSLGGSETAAIYMARALAKRGHFVVVCAPGAEGKLIDGVSWLPIEQFGPYTHATPHDVTIISRAAELMQHKYASKLRVMWAHDLALKRQRGVVGGTAWNLDWIYVLSEFERKQYRQVHSGLPESALFTTRNGIDLAVCRELQKFPRDKTRLVYGSRPERGLETALNLMAELHRRGSKITLRVAGYDNTVEPMRAYYEHLWTRCREAPNITLLGPLKQQEWRQELAGAGALLYPGCPGAFREISCIAAIEAMAVGTPTIAVAKGAVPETLGATFRADDQEREHDLGFGEKRRGTWDCRTGILLGDEATNPHLHTYTLEMADACEQLVADPMAWQRLSVAARQRGAAYDWSGVAEQWERHWTDTLAERSKDPVRLAKHLAREGDHEALEALGAATA